MVLIILKIVIFIFTCIVLYWLFILTSLCYRRELIFVYLQIIIVFHVEAFTISINNQIDQEHSYISAVLVSVKVSFSHF